MTVSEVRPVRLGLAVGGRTFLDGDVLDTVVVIPDARTEIVLLPAPDGGAGVELARFIRPDHEPGSPAAMATELRLRSVAFEVDDLPAIVREQPEGVLVSLAQRRR